MVCTVSLVCRVENTRCQVSARVKAAFMVSGSRISHTMMIFGSSRRQDFIARSKLLVCTPTSRWLMRDILFLNTYSIGSSIVMICFLKFVLIYCIIAARFVDFPDPVGPVIKMSHFDFSHSLLIVSPNQRDSNVGISSLMRRNAIEFPFVSLKQLTR